LGHPKFTSIKKPLKIKKPPHTEAFYCFLRYGFVKQIAAKENIKNSTNNSKLVNNFYCRKANEDLFLKKKSRTKLF
jgi:hypothetical protein